MAASGAKRGEPNTQGAKSIEECYSTAKCSTIYATTPTQAPPPFAQQAGSSKGQGPRQRNQWRQKGVSIPGVNDQTVLGNFPETSNKFGALGEDNEMDHLAIPHPPTMAEFFTTVFELAGKQARANRGRSISHNPRLRANQGPERKYVPLTKQDTSPLEVPMQEKDATYKASPDVNLTKNEGTLMQLNTEEIPNNKDETEPADVIVEHEEQ